MATDDLTELLDRATARQQSIHQAPPLPLESLASLFDDFALRQAHATTALEGNTLTLDQSQAVLEHGITIPGKSFREHLEVVNAHATWVWLLPLVRQGVPVNDALLCETHRRLMQGILGDDAGIYRRVPVYIRGSGHISPNWVKVPLLVQDWLAQYAEGPRDRHPVRFAAQAHIDLVRIHPFLDGNGRTTRMMTNVLLMQAGYPPALYAAEAREDYLQALRHTDTTQDIGPFVAMTARAVAFMQDRWLALIQQMQEAEGHPSSRNAKPATNHRPLDR